MLSIQDVKKIEKELLEKYTIDEDKLHALYLKYTQGWHSLWFEQPLTEEEWRDAIMRDVAEKLNGKRTKNYKKALGEYAVCFTRRNYKWYTNGTTNIQVWPQSEVPEGFHPGRVKRTQFMKTDLYGGDENPYIPNKEELIQELENKKPLNCRIVPLFLEPYDYSEDMINAVTALKGSPLTEDETFWVQATQMVRFEYRPQVSHRAKIPKWDDPKNVWEYARQCAAE